MSEVAIRVESLGKKYHLGSNKAADLRNAFGDFISSINNSKAKQSLPDSQSSKGDFWALKDISFEVKKGEAIGIIGRNGAGKSTLLKILSRITEPTKGYYTLNGRVSSLLEVGTGFHMELTGRENIFLNGTILGMKRREIRLKFDEIVDFSGVEQFIDTPVKHYSSGMKVRLAFSVAAHLEPEILLIDEVLAVGDSEFQKKCLGKMEDVTGQGRTVLFVSHNMNAVSTLTNRSLILNNGEKLFDGFTGEAINTYLNINKATNHIFTSKPSTTTPKIIRAEVFTSNENKVHLHGKNINFEFQLSVPKKLTGASFSFQILNNKDIPIIHLWTFDSEREMCKEPGIYTLRCQVDKIRLYMGEYHLKAYFTGPPNTEKYHIIDGICPFKIEMYNKYREFQYRPEMCSYIEDAKWKIINSNEV
jgi:lipopolysaccharide transport system ATP-binding protein